MTKDIYRYRFPASVPMQDVEVSLLLAIWGAESLHGEAQVRLDAAHALDGDKRACVIDAGSLVGQAINRLFVGFVQHQFGAEGFKVERVDAVPTRQPQETCA